MSDGCVIECEGLRKQYGAVAALAGVDLRVPQGSIHGFLGRNGAGKTTTIKVLLGMVRPTDGSARVFGWRADDPVASVDIRRRTGFVSEDKDLYDAMTVEETIAFTAQCYPRWRRDLQDRYMRLFELPSSARVRTLSRGARTKLSLLLACCRGAELLVLDEPTSGLDPAAADEVLQMLVSHVGAEGVTVFMSSHQLTEVDQIADRIAIIHRGKVMLAGVLEDLRGEFRRIRLVFEHDAPLVDFRAPGIVRVRRDGRLLTVTAIGNVDPISAEARAVGAVSIDVGPMPLKDMFLDLVTTEE